MKSLLLFALFLAGGPALAGKGGVQSGAPWLNLIGQDDHIPAILQITGEATDGSSSEATTVDGEVGRMVFSFPSIAAIGTATIYGTFFIAGSGSFPPWSPGQIGLTMLGVGVVLRHTWGALSGTNFRTLVPVEPKHHQFYSIRYRHGSDRRFVRRLLKRSPYLHDGERLYRPAKLLLTGARTGRRQILNEDTLDYIRVEQVRVLGVDLDAGEPVHDFETRWFFPSEVRMVSSCRSLLERAIRAVF